MSWDASLTCDCCGHEVGEWNYTHNTGRMIQEARRAIGHHVDEPWWMVLDRMPAPIGAHYLGQIITALEADPPRYQAMDPANGWGSYGSLLRVLREMRDRSTAENPMTWRVYG